MKTEIEPGCIAMVCKTVSDYPEYVGRVFRVLEVAPDGELCDLCHQDNWGYLGRDTDLRHLYTCVCSLVRIDDPDFSEETDKEVVTNE